MLRRFASVMAVGALAITSYSVMAAAPASAGKLEKKPNKVEVTKVVVGDSHGEGFQVVVDCQHEEKDGVMLWEKYNSGPETLTFGPEGGTKSVDAANGVTCTIVETHDGGASKVDVSPSTCEFPEEEVVKVDDNEGKTCKVTVTNTFVPEQEEAGPAGPAGPQGPPGPPGESAAAATAVVSTARFTG